MHLSYFPIFLPLEAFFPLQFLRESKMLKAVATKSAQKEVTSLWSAMPQEALLLSSLGNEKMAPLSILTKQITYQVTFLRFLTFMGTLRSNGNLKSLKKVELKHTCLG